MLDYLQQRKSTSASEEGQPFFAYLPFTAPHYPLQCLRSDRERYKGLYKDGPDVLRQRRLANLAKSGIVDPRVIPHQVVSPDNAQWDDMSPKEQVFSARAMEC